VSRAEAVTGCRALALLALVLTVAVQLPNLDRPFGHSMASIVATRYTGRIEFAYRKLGFAACAGIPQVQLLPGEALGEPYLHHPPGYAWANHAVVRAFGHAERSFRLLPVAASALSAALLVLLIGHAAGTATAGLAALLALTSPMGHLYGAMAGSASTVLACLLATLWLHERLRLSTRLAYAAVPLVAALGTFADWSGAFALPAVLALELGRPPAERRLGRVLGLLLGLALALLATLALFVAWVGPEAVLEQLATAFASGAGLLASNWTWTGWAENQLGFWTGLFTLPLAIATAVCSIAFLLPAWLRRDPWARLAVALALPALLNVALFPEPAFDHEFWWYFALPFAALGGAVVARRLWIHLHPIAGIALVVWIAAAGVLEIADRLEADATTQYREFGAAVAAFAGPDDLLLSPGMIAQEHFYIDAFSCEGVQTRARLDELVGRWRAGGLGPGRLFFLMPPDLGSTHPDLAARVPEVAALLPGNHGVVWRIH
jgi:4-amino-4-deoxy-L-arabinose transferase-like glycosyltransferase